MHIYAHIQIEYTYQLEIDIFREGPMNGKFPDGFVLAVCVNPSPGIPKIQVDSIQLLEELGVEGDYHAGEKVRHRYLAKKDPDMPNRRQVLLIDAQILGDLVKAGIQLSPGQMGENMVFYGINVMALKIGTRLAAGDALLEISEVRDPCRQLNDSHPDLYLAVIKEINGEERYTAGVFARVIRGGKVNTGDPIYVYR